MTDDTESRGLTILKDLQSRMKRLDDGMANLELRMTAQEQHLGACSVFLPLA